MTQIGIHAVSEPPRHEREREMPINEIEMVITPAAPGMSRPENVQRNKKKKEYPQLMRSSIHPSIRKRRFCVYTNR